MLRKATRIVGRFLPGDNRKRHLRAFEPQTAAEQATFDCGFRDGLEEKPYLPPSGSDRFRDSYDAGYQAGDRMVMSAW